MTASILKRATAELLGTGALVAAAVGSGIMAERLCGGNAGLALLASTLATGAALVALIAALAPISGAHMNPVVTLVDAWSEGKPAPDAIVVIAAQLAGACLSVLVVHVMFDLPLLQASSHARSGAGQVLGEAVATFGLVFVVVIVGNARPQAIPFAVAAWIMAAYWFTSSTSFANPAGTLARAFTDTPAGIRLADVPGFLGGELVGGLLGYVVARWLQDGRPVPR